MEFDNAKQTKKYNIILYKMLFFLFKLLKWIKHSKV